MMGTKVEVDDNKNNISNFRKVWEVRVVKNGSGIHIQPEQMVLICVFVGITFIEALLSR